MMFLWTLISLPLATVSLSFSSIFPRNCRRNNFTTQQQHHPPSIVTRGGVASNAKVDTETADEASQMVISDEIFESFASFLIKKQREIINEIESMDGSGEMFSEDKWGAFNEINENDATVPSESGGITRVLQDGNVVEKGACSLTLIRNGVLSAERAATVSGRSGVDVAGGDSYSAAALSIVLHTRSPLVPTFRSDVRIFLVRAKDRDDDNKGEEVMAWFGGGADLTPYYLFDSDIEEFHGAYQNLCSSHFPQGHDLAESYSYQSMKRWCDEYFYLPARSEHRGTGGIFFDDMAATADTLRFVEGVANTWMPSWMPIVKRHKDGEYTDEQRRWQLLRRGRYLEFNLLYDRGVKFGLANANPRVEGVMVSAPPLIAWEYNHEVAEGSEEERLMKILKEPKDWVFS